MMDMDPDRCSLELQRILDRSLECTSKLADLLHDERSALESQDTEQLRAITTCKEQCVQRLESLESERLALCATVGYDANAAGMKEMLNWCDGSFTVTPAWEGLLQRARQCDALNQTNGAIDRIRYKHVMSALAVPSGDGGSISLYGPEGQQSDRFEQRALARI